MKSPLLFLALLALAPAAFAQDGLDAATIARIRDEGLNRSQLPQTLSYLTDVIGPRLTGSPGLLRANEWTKGKLMEWGLQNAKLEPGGPFGRGWTCDKFSLQVVGGTDFPIIALPKAWSPSVKASGEIVYLDAQTEADLAKFKGKLKGKIVLVGQIRPVPAHFAPQGTRYTDEALKALEEAPGGPRRQPGGGNPFGRPGGAGAGGQFQLQRSLQWFLKTEGAAAVLDAARGDGGTIFVQQASVASPPPDPNAPDPGPRLGGGARRVSPWKKESDGKIVPQIAVSAEHFNRLVRMIQAGEKVKLELELKARYNGDDSSMVNNTTAEIPGSDLAGEVVMCGGHLDSWHGGTGATDNAAGVSVCMEAVRIIQALGIKPRRTIRVAAWSGEEQGIFGSSAYVKQHFGTAAQPTAEHGKISAYFNLDNGTGKIRGVWGQGNTAILSIFSEWLKPFNDLGATTLTARNTGGTDHLSFDAVGIPGFQFIQDEIEYDARTHHSNQDVYDRIQEGDLKQAATIMAAFLLDAANRDEKLPRKPAVAPN